MSVIDLDAERKNRTPHAQGEARCLDCKHAWQAVAPLDVVWLECPQCTLMRGRFLRPFERNGEHWVCRCSNDVFYLTPRGEDCPIAARGRSDCEN